MSAACAARPSSSLIATTLADEIAFTTSARCAMLSSRAPMLANSASRRAPARRASPSSRCAELFLREPAELLGLPLEALIEPDDRQAERGRERDRRGRDDRDDQPGAERRKAEQDLVLGGVRPSLDDRNAAHAA